MKGMGIDDSAHACLMWAKKKCIEEGVEKPNMSEAIRWLDRKAHEAVERDELVNEYKKDRRNVLQRG